MSDGENKLIRVAFFGVHSVQDYFWNRVLYFSSGSLEGILYFTYARFSQGISFTLGKIFWNRIQCNLDNWHTYDWHTLIIGTISRGPWCHVYVHGISVS